MAFSKCNDCGGPVHSKKLRCLRCGAYQQFDNEVVESEAPIAKTKPVSESVLLADDYPSRRTGHPRKQRQTDTNQRQQPRSFSQKPKPNIIWRVIKWVLIALAVLILAIMLFIGVLYINKRGTTKDPLPEAVFSAWYSTIGGHLLAKRAKADISAMMRDPDSTQFRNLKQSGFRMVCVEVNSKNGFGAYTGFKMMEYWGGIGDMEPMIRHAVSVSSCFD